jgi:hypothetical protein
MRIANPIQLFSPPKEIFSLSRYTSFGFFLVPAGVPARSVLTPRGEEVLGVKCGAAAYVGRAALKTGATERNVRRRRRLGR